MDPSSQGQSQGASPFLLPWEGPLYAAEGFRGVRILVLGESHYAFPEEWVPDFTREVVRDLAISGRSKHSKLFTKVAALALGVTSASHMAPKQRTDFWNRVAFYNYIQAFLDAARKRPTHEQWAAAHEPLLWVLRQLHPDVMLVLGKQLAQNLPELPADLNVCVVAHPSSVGFSYARWRPALEVALTTAAARGVPFQRTRP